MLQWLDCVKQQLDAWLELEVMTVDWIAGYGHLHLPFPIPIPSQFLIFVGRCLFVCLSVLSGWLFWEYSDPRSSPQFRFHIFVFSVFHRAQSGNERTHTEFTKIQKKHTHTATTTTIENWKLSKLLNYWESPQEDMWHIHLHTVQKRYPVALFLNCELPQWRSTHRWYLLGMHWESNINRIRSKLTRHM